MGMLTWVVRVVVTGAITAVRGRNHGCATFRSSVGTNYVSLCSRKDVLRTMLIVNSISG